MKKFFIPLIAAAALLIAACTKENIPGDTGETGDTGNTENTENPGNTETPDTPVTPPDTPGESLLEFVLSILEATTNDIKVSIDAPEELPIDEKYGDPISYIVRWAPVSEIGNLSDEELFQRELDLFKADYEEYAGMSWWSYTSAVISYTLLHGDVPECSLKTLANQIKCEIKENTEYEVYVYAVEIDEEAKTCRLLTKIARERATTLAVEGVEMSFEFGWDRITNDAYGLSAYCSVTPSNNEQTFTFYTIAHENAGYMYEGFTEMNDDAARSILQGYISQNAESLWPVDPAEWTYTGYAFAGEYDALSIKTNQSENVYYIIAAALDEEYNICSDVVWTRVDITGMTSTDAEMNLNVTDNGNGSYTYTTDPTGYAAENSHIVIAITVSEMEKYLEENHYYDTDVDTYAKDVVKQALAELMATGSDIKTAVKKYLAEGDNARSGQTSDNITVTEDTYVISYSLYETSGTLNGLDYKLLKAPVAEATVVELTEADGVQIGFVEAYGATYKYQFNLKWNEGLIRFRNQDGTWDTDLNAYTHTKHIKVGQPYTTEDSKHNIYVEFTYLGNPDNQYDSNNIFIKEGSLIVEANNNGTYTVTADIIWKDNAHYRYIYTGAIADELINGTSAE